jgi:ATP sulfurylase
MSINAKLIFITPLILLVNALFANKYTNNDSVLLLKINREIDKLVVENKVDELKNYYAADFVFTHGSGKKDSKETWLQSVAKGNFISRVHDSVSVEMHNNIAIVKGRLDVQKRGKEEEIKKYYLWYIRVYRLNKKLWQLISHTTYFEAHL